MVKPDPSTLALRDVILERILHGAWREETIDADKKLADRGCIEQLENFHREYLPFYSRDILQRIKVCDDSWQQMVPSAVAEVIKRNGFFGYQPPVAISA